LQEDYTSEVSEVQAIKTWLLYSVRHLLCRWGLANDFTSAIAPVIKKAVTRSGSGSLQGMCSIEFIDCIPATPTAAAPNGMAQGWRVEDDDQFKNETLARSAHLMRLFL
jgi:hypothetical protein